MAGKYGQVLQHIKLGYLFVICDTKPFGLYLKQQ
jgi:hypothetical protein